MGLTSWSIPGEIIPEITLCAPIYGRSSMRIRSANVVRCQVRPACGAESPVNGLRLFRSITSALEGPSRFRSGA